jgi:LysM repeat protein
LPTELFYEKSQPMNMKTHLASLVFVLASSGPLMSATETERLRALCAEQEMQIRQLEERIAQLTDTPPPSRLAPAAPVETPVSAPVSEAATYTVKSGDSIERIARQHGTTVSALAKLNGIKDGAIIHPGQKLKVPGKAAVAATPSAPAMESRTHTVVTGDTFFKIAMTYGVSVDELIAANPNVNHKALRVGQKIIVNSAVPAVAKAPAPSLASPPATPILNKPAPAPAPVEKPRASDRPLRIDKEITYGEFATKHGTTTRRLDELNGLELDPSTVLAQGSELYIPAQP